MKKYTFSNKYYKILIEYLPLSILIRIGDKRGDYMSAISETCDELFLDFNQALSYLSRCKCARRWFRNKINLSYYES